MITGVHGLIYSTEPDALRAFFRDLLEFPSVDAGDGWLIFALPPAELGVHPTEGDAHHAISLMCDDIEATVSELKAKGVEFVDGGAVQNQGFGLCAFANLPGAGAIQLYQPLHKSPLTPG